MHGYQMMGRGKGIPGGFQWCWSNGWSPRHFKVFCLYVCHLFHLFPLFPSDVILLIIQGSESALLPLIFLNELSFHCFIYYVYTSAIVFVWEFMFFSALEPPLPQHKGEVMSDSSLQTVLCMEILTYLCIYFKLLDLTDLSYGLEL